MSKSWIFIYIVAILLDIVLICLEYVGIGIVLDRLINLLAGMAFAFYFIITGTSGWFWRLIADEAVEVLPIIGDISKIIPVPVWTITVWRIQRANLSNKTEESVENTREEILEEQRQQDELTYEDGVSTENSVPAEAV